MGGISTNRCLVAWAAVLVRILLSGWVVERVVVCGWWVVFGTLLGPEATGLRGRSSLWGVAVRVCLFLVSWPGRSCAVALFCGGCVWGVGFGVVV
jgi:hypothetical protein